MGGIVRLVLPILAIVAATTLATPLDDYVNMPDHHYSYTVLKEYVIPGEYTAYVLNMTSQKWLTCKCHLDIFPQIEHLCLIINTGLLAI